MPTGAHGAPYKPELQNNFLTENEALTSGRAYTTSKNNPSTTNPHYIPEPVGCVIRTDSFFAASDMLKALLSVTSRK